MISMSALLIVIGVCALIGTHLFIMHWWLSENEDPRPVPRPITMHSLPCPVPA
jgi:hypothetical protein